MKNNSYCRYCEAISVGTLMARSLQAATLDDVKFKGATCSGGGYLGFAGLSPSQMKTCGLTGIDVDTCRRRSGRSLLACGQGPQFTALDSGRTL